jgi:hypothetical protein
MRVLRYACDKSRTHPGGVQMPVFSNDGELYACIGGMMEKATTDRAMGEKVRDSRLIIKFSYSNPTATITIDAKNDPPEGTFFRVLYGDNDLVPDVSMKWRRMWRTGSGSEKSTSRRRSQGARSSLAARSPRF